LTVLSNRARWQLAKLRLKAGKSIAFSLNFSEEGPAVLPPARQFGRERLQLTSDWCVCGLRNRLLWPIRAARVRSALVLTLLPTRRPGRCCCADDILPERVGGDLNWDYRFAWLRDAAFHRTTHFSVSVTRMTTKAFVNLAFACHQSHPRAITRDLRCFFGERPLRELSCSVSAEPRFAAGEDWQCRQRTVAARHLRRSCRGRLLFF